MAAQGYFTPGDMIVGIGPDTQVWRKRPETALPTWPGRGRKPTRVRLCPGQTGAEAVKAVAASVPTVQHKWGQVCR